MVAALGAGYRLLPFTVRGIILSPTCHILFHCSIRCHCNEKRLAHICLGATTRGERELTKRRCELTPAMCRVQRPQFFCYKFHCVTLHSLFPTPVYLSTCLPLRVCVLVLLLLSYCVCCVLRSACLFASLSRALSLSLSLSVSLTGFACTCNSCACFCT